MGQITIYLDDELEAKIRAQAKRHKVSRSRFIASVLEQHLLAQWPAEVREAAGSWRDFPNLAELRGDLGQDVRESL